MNHGRDNELQNGSRIMKKDIHGVIRMKGIV